MRARVLGSALVVLVCALAAAAPAGATKECDGLQVCISVDGPWVVVPAATGLQRQTVEWQVTCPRGHVAGGLDARISQRAIDLHFLGRLGSPVNPGISTERAVVFVGRFVGATPRAPTFKPFAGCMPSRGGGSRIQTSVSAFPPGTPATRRVKTVRVRPGTVTVANGCRPGERLVGASHAFGFNTRTPPSASLVSTVSGTQSVGAGRVSVRVRGDAELGGVRALLQVHAVCSSVR